MNQYRCTIPEYYEEGCPGHTNMSARQGHYITAETETEAISQMHLNFPKVSKIDVQLWKEGVV